MADNWNGDPLYELARQGATPAQLKWAEDQMGQGLPYVDGNGKLLSGAGWSTNLPYKPMSGAPAPGKQDRYRPVLDPQTLQPLTLGNAQYPTGNRLTPNAIGYTQQGTMTGANPAVVAIDGAAQPGRQVVPFNTRFASLTSSVPPNYGNYTATMRAANPNPLIAGPAYTPQPVAGDPWGGMRMNGQAAAPMPGYSAAPGAAQAQQQARGLFDSLFGGGSSAAPSLYSPSSGSYMPTMAPGGKQRRKDADRSSASPTGSGGSLVGR